MFEEGAILFIATLCPVRTPREFCSSKWELGGRYFYTTEYAVLFVFRDPFYYLAVGPCHLLPTHDLSGRLPGRIFLPSIVCSPLLCLSLSSAFALHANCFCSGFPNILWAQFSTRQIRRERRSVYEDAGVSVTAYQGDSITDDMLETAFFIYKATIDKVQKRLEILIALDFPFVSAWCVCCGLPYLKQK